jgi:hypothetical protein
MCMGGSKASAPTPAAQLPEAPQAPDVAAAKKNDGTRQRVRAATANGTILTGGQGAVAGDTATKTLLGG